MGPAHRPTDDAPREPINDGRNVELAFRSPDISEVSDPPTVGHGRPRIMLLSEGQMSDYKGAALMLTALPNTRELLDDKGSMQIGFARLSPNAASLPASRQNPIAKKPIEHDRTLYRQRHKIENIFGRLRIGGASIPLRSMRPYLHVSNLHHCDCYLLIIINES